MLRSPLNQGPVHDEGRKSIKSRLMPAIPQSHHVRFFGISEIQQVCREFQSTSGVPKWLLRFCQGIFKMINSISTLEDLWLKIVANKKLKPTTSSRVSVLLSCRFLSFWTSVISTQVENEAKLERVF